MNTCKTCKTCRHWGVYQANACDFVNAPASSEDPATRFEVRAWAADDSRLEVRLKTGPDFGCIHWSER